MNFGRYPAFISRFFQSNLVKCELTTKRVHASSRSADRNDETGVIQQFRKTPSLARKSWGIEPNKKSDRTWLIPSSQLQSSQFSGFPCVVSTGSNIPRSSPRLCKKASVCSHRLFHRSQWPHPPIVGSVVSICVNPWKKISCGIITVINLQIAWFAWFRPSISSHFWPNWG